MKDLLSIISSATTALETAKRHIDALTAEERKSKEALQALRDLAVSFDSASAQLLKKREYLITLLCKLILAFGKKPTYEFQEVQSGIKIVQFSNAEYIKLYASKQNQRTHTVVSSKALAKEKYLDAFQMLCALILDDIRRIMLEGPNSLKRQAKDLNLLFEFVRDIPKPE